jgi:hypothetical protein
MAIFHYSPSENTTPARPTWTAAAVPVKEKFFLRGKASYKAKSSDWRIARAANAVLGKYGLEKKAKQ